MKELNSFYELFQDGGFIMIPLILICVVLWWAIFQRIDLLLKRKKDDQYQPLINVLTAAAPLLGLLGTVIGMIETFDSLADMALFTQGGGIAAGISQALLTTQMGLMIAIPGLMAGRFLQRYEDKLLSSQEVFQ